MENKFNPFEYGLPKNPIWNSNLNVKPNKYPCLIRNKGSSSFTIHADNWLVEQIHGKDYEWCEPSPLEKVIVNEKGYYELIYK